MKQEIHVTIWFNVFIILMIFIVSLIHFQRTEQWAVFLAPILVGMFFQPTATIIIDDEEENNVLKKEISI